MCVVWCTVCVVCCVVCDMRQYGYIVSRTARYVVCGVRVVLCVVYCVCVVMCIMVCVWCMGDVVCYV